MDISEFFSDFHNNGSYDTFFSGQGSMSEGSWQLFDAFGSALYDSDEGIIGYFLWIISEILPIALTVAGAILVVNLGWRLFRNFTRG